MTERKFSRRNFNKGALGFLAALGLGKIGTGCDERDGNKPTLQDTFLEDTAKLKDFPYMMAKDGVFNGYLIVGNYAPAEDVVASTDIALGITINAGLQLAVDHTSLASEISNLDKHAVLIGRDYDNPLIQTGEVPTLNPGEGYLGLEKQNGLYRLIVSGYDSLNIRQAARVLNETCKDPAKFNLNCKKAIVTGTSLTDLTVQSLE